MTIFLTGASGLVGSAFACAAARRGHRVTGTLGSFTGEIEGLAARRPVDLADSGAVTSAVLDVFPQAIVNCAALASPADCEADPARAQALNVRLPATLAQLAHHVSARLIHLSSEQVFDGARATPFTTSDAPAPLNLYGRQKLESERLVHARAPNFATTLRAPLLLGDSLSGRRGLHERLFAAWAAGRAPRLFADEFRQPCSAENLAEVMVELCERSDTFGVFHWAGTELLSRGEIGARIRDHFKLTERQAPIEIVTRASMPDVARRRPARLAFDLAPLAGRLKTRPPSFAEQLADLKVPHPCREWYLAQS